MSVFPLKYNKSGTAILLFRIPRLWYCLLIQTTTLKPTPYVKLRALCAYIIYIPMDILVLQCLGLCEFTRFRNAKTERVRRLFQYVLYLPPTRKTYTLGVGSILQNFSCHKGTIFSFCGAKVHKKNDMCKS